MGTLLAARLRRSVDGGRDHHVRVEGPVRRRWDPEAVDARADAHEVGFVRPMSCPPSRTAIAAPFFVFRTRKATSALLSIIQGRLRVFSPRAILFAPPRLSPWRPSPPLARPCPCPCPCPCALRNLDFSVDISAYVRVTTRHEAKTPGKQILTTLPKNFGARL